MEKYVQQTMLFWDMKLVTDSGVIHMVLPDETCQEADNI